MVAVPSQITQRVITRPQYANAETFDVWLRVNHMAAWDYWCQLDEAAGNDAERVGAALDFFDFAKCQYDIACASSEVDEEEDEASPRRFRSSDEYEAYEAGVPARGEI